MIYLLSGATGDPVVTERFNVAFFFQCDIIVTSTYEDGNMKLYHGTNYRLTINIMKFGIQLKYSQRYLDFGPGF